MKITCSILAADYIADLVRQFYALGDVENCTFISQGLNDTYSIICGHGKFIARLYRHNWRSREEIECEIDFVNHLATRSAPVAPFLPGKNGACVYSVQCPEGERFLALMECASGSEYETHAIPHNSPFNYGQSVGLLHTAAMGFAPTKIRRPLDAQHLISLPLAAVEQQFFQHTSELINPAEK